MIWAQTLCPFLGTKMFTIKNQTRKKTINKRVLIGFDQGPHDQILYQSTSVE